LEAGASWARKGEGGVWEESRACERFQTMFII